MVLGIQWIASLNTIQANWNEMFLIFQLKEKTYKLQGVPRKTITTTYFHLDFEEQMLTRDAMLNLMKADYKHIDLSSNVSDASILRLQPYGQKSMLVTLFPDFRLEDKSSFQEGCTDKARIFHTYSRRKK
ncbi:hypothetical protein KY285_023682 [Solanum tuberosum]|nr:hypothetical protein KY289_024008 [Solanum tuberosum]KAH0675881.1 hypothetical protein KY285_023682 [Solanum tuberosum]